MAYTEQEINQRFDDILNLIASGSPAYKAMKDKLSPSTFYEMLENDKEKANRYARACAQRADLIFEETLDIADETKEDIILKDGVPIENPKVVQRDRLRVETRKWFLAKLHPKKYGDKAELDVNVSSLDLKPKEEFLMRIKRVKEESEDNE
jgi:hypothetical protein